MQNKINIIIWSFVFIVILFFGVLYIYNPFQLKEYRFVNTDKIQVEVKLYSKDQKNAKETISNVKKTSFNEDDLVYLESLLDVVKNSNIKAYTIRVGENIVVGDHYQGKTYRIALSNRLNGVYQILDLKNTTILVQNQNKQDTFDRVIVLSKQFSSAKETLLQIQDKSLDEIKEVKKDEIILLKGEEEVYHFKKK